MRIPADIASTPASNQAIGDAERQLACSIPPALRELYTESDGLASGSGNLIYSAADLPERNRMFEVATYAPGFVAVGDDRGGRVLLMSSSGEALWVDAGSMDPAHGDPLEMPWDVWIEAGLPPASEEEDCPPRLIDIYLERAPEGALGSLVLLKRELSLEVSSKQLLALVDQVPVRLQRAVPYGRALTRCRRINAVVDCVGLRHVDDPARPVDT